MGYKPHAQVAHRTFQRIDEVDGVLTTHKQHGWVHAWTVTNGPNTATPLPVTAKKFVPAWIAVSAMCALVLTMMVAALVVVLDGHPDTLTIAAASFGLLGVWTVLLMLPAIVRSRR